MTCADIEHFALCEMIYEIMSFDVIIIGNWEVDVPCRKKDNQPLNVCNHLTKVRL